MPFIENRVVTLYIIKVQRRDLLERKPVFFLNNSQNLKPYN